MKIKSFLSFIKENNSLNDISTDTSSLLRSIDAEQILMGDEFDFNSERFTDIDSLAQNGDFIFKIDKKGYKRNNTEDSKDSETFLDDGDDIKFFLIFKKEDSELDPKPEFIIIQSKKKDSSTWGSIKMYKVKENIRNFYDKLSSKTIEIKKGDKNYIYKTSNAGNDWTIQNTQNKDSIFKDIMSRDEIKDALSDKTAKIEVVD